LPKAVLAGLATTQEQVRRYLIGEGLERNLRWSPVKNLHLTLRFLGDTTPNQCKAVAARLNEVAASHAPFTLSVDVSGRALDGFPNLRQPRVLWSGVEGDLDALHHVQAALEASVQALGFAPEEKAYSPHLTLARAARDAGRRALNETGSAIEKYRQQLPVITGAASSDLIRFPVEQLIFYQSELGAGGSRYTVLATLSLLRA
jgi:2'-5' RNA ligase